MTQGLLGITVKRGKEIGSEGEQALIKIKRVYDPVDGEDGVRFLVDRLWPRGIGKNALKADVWLKNAAPA